MVPNSIHTITIIPFLTPANKGHVRYSQEHLPLQHAISPVSQQLVNTIWSSTQHLENMAKA